jgi:coenzyme F420 biosynthesis associated uncharacterized protein
VDTIDWKLAQRVGEMLAGTGPYLASHPAAMQPLAEEFAARVCSYSGLRLTDPLPPVELIDRRGWIEANIATMRPLLEPFSARMGSGEGPMAGALRSISGTMLGAQVGAVTGLLSQRVLGQYEIALLDAEPEPRLLLLAPNLAQTARSLEVDREDLTSWVAIHEVTHAVQFGGAPWLRSHLAGLLSELIEGLDVKVGSGRSLRLPDAEELRDLARRLRAGDLLRLTLGEERWALVERMQATMSVIEGHAEHVMDAVGAEVLPTLDRLRAAMTRRRRERAWPWRILERLIGMEMKLRQYELGRSFCDEIVATAGPGALSVVWSSPEMLPSSAELNDASSWLARTQSSSGTVAERD